MARVEGFEPPTAWFVARYSIQLSYTRLEIDKLFNQNKTHRMGGFHCMARVEGFEPPTAWFVARYSIQLSYTRFNFLLVCFIKQGGTLIKWRVWKDSNLRPPGS